MMAHAFRVCQVGYIEDPKGQMNKLVVGELLYIHGIKPPYTNANQWNKKRSKMTFNIRYPTMIFMVYLKEKVNYMSNRNAFTFMKVEEGIEVDWA
jgi:hypothetical protein